jgi:phosphoribosylformimino-5-aminoimidazole carboxamide ribotide isomerase
MPDSVLRRRGEVRIIPVIDVMGGVVVRAVGGRREEYRPIRSRLTQSTDLSDVAASLLQTTGAGELYVADLDAIRWGIACDVVWRFVTDSRVTIYLDGGGLGPAGRPHIRHVLGLEVDDIDPDKVRHWAREKGQRLTFSIDLLDGRLHEGSRKWGLNSAGAILGLAQRVHDLGIRSLIVLDLRRVGMAEGVGTEPICRAIRDELPAVELITGGGVRNWDDVRRLEDAGADAVLVASALHDGTLTLPRPAS